MMTHRFTTFQAAGGAALLAIVTSFASWAAHAEEPRSNFQQPVYRVAGAAARNAPAGAAGQLDQSFFEHGPNEHPLAPAIRWSQRSLQHIDANIKDYSATMFKRERIDGELGEYQQMFIKIRHQPFSVYTGFVAPASLKGQEAIYVAGANDGKMWAHATGIRHKLLGTVSLAPTSSLAMSGNLHPITEIGMRRLNERLIEAGQRDMKFGECEVKITPGAKVGDRPCTSLQIVHPIARKNFDFHKAVIYVDDQLIMPIRYERYSWPQQQGGAPILDEEYTYTNIKINNGFTDADFDKSNPAYNF